jgi:hypothetical protein
MERVSSQLTIFIRIALPTIWLTTILSLTLLLGMTVRGKAQVFSNPIVWLVLLFILGTGFAFIYFILWKFYRVDMDERYVYVSNYFKTFKYPFSDIENIRDSKLLPGRIFVIVLKSKGSFGKEISFLASQKLWSDFVAGHPEIFHNILT